MQIKMLISILLACSALFAAAFTKSATADQGREVNMLTVRKDQIEVISRARFIEKLDVAFSRDVPGFVECAPEDRRAFLSEAISLAETKGLKTEQGLASYALALWWLGVGFEEKSNDLKSLLQSSYPEVRKIHAMNEWVNAMIGDPENISAADEALKRGIKRTEAWGPPN